MLVLSFDLAGSFSESSHRRVDDGKAGLLVSHARMIDVDAASSRALRYEGSLHKLTTKKI